MLILHMPSSKGEKANVPVRLYARGQSTYLKRKATLLRSSIFRVEGYFPYYVLGLQYLLVCQAVKTLFTIPAIISTLASVLYIKKDFYRTYTKYPYVRKLVVPFTGTILAFYASLLQNYLKIKRDGKMHKFEGRSDLRKFLLELVEVRTYLLVSIILLFSSFVGRKDRGQREDPNTIVPQNTSGSARRIRRSQRVESP